MHRRTCNAFVGTPRSTSSTRAAHDSLDATIERLWLLLGAGVLGGALLALLAGLAVAGRAMRPISSLTAAAREIAATRDPSRRLPATETDDEVAELARTLDQMLRELDAARSETQQMIQSQRDFVADASHELRTPLTSILANLELLEASLAERGADPEEEEIVAGALGSSRRMRRLVSDLLLLARADAGRAGPRRDCDLVEIATAALAEVRPVAGDHELVLEADGQGARRGQPGRPPPARRQPARERRPPHPAGKTGHDRGPARGRARCSRSPTTAPGSRRRSATRSSPASSAATAPRI